MGEPETEDGALIRAAKAGDCQAAEALLCRYQQGLFDFLRRMLKSPQDAEDALQEAMLKALRGLDGYQDRGQFKAWIYCIAQREGLQVIRRRQTLRHRLTQSGDEVVMQNAPTRERGPLEHVIGIECLEWLEAKVDRLPKNERRVFLLRADQGLSFGEIADLMECPINTALGRMRNASLKLRRWIGSRRSSGGANK